MTIQAQEILVDFINMGLEKMYFVKHILADKIQWLENIVCTSPDIRLRKGDKG